MQKKIIALAIASALVAPAAFADTSNVTVYGIADVSYDSIRTGNSTAAVAGVTSNRVSSNASRIGLKGSEDLGNGLAAIWQVESLVNIGNGGSAGTGIGGRDTFAGLSSGTIGTVILGRHDTPYKMTTRKFDVFADGIADNRSIMGGQPAVNVGAAGALTASGFTSASAAASFDGRQDQVAAYISPKFGDIFTGAIAYVNLNPAYSIATANKATAWSAAGMFDIAGGFYGSLAYEVHDLTSVAAVVPASPAPAVLAAGAKEHATKLGLGYTQDAFAVGFAYEKTADNLAAGANAFGHTDIYLSGKYMFGSDAVKAAFTKANNTGATANTGAKQFSLGYDHSMSKRTTLYALYTKIRNDAAAGYALSNNSSVGGASTSAGLGASPSAFAIGMKHTF